MRSILSVGKLKNKRNILYTCASCPSQTTEIHEVFFGVHRQNAVKYHLQAPLCVKCHKKAHSSTLKTSEENLALQYKVRRKLCEILDIDMWDTLLALNTRNHTYLEGLKERCLKKIEFLQA